MKNVFTLIVLSFFLSSSLMAQSKDTESKNTVKVYVSGLVCGFCASKVESNFKKLPEVESIHVNLDENLDDKKNDSYVILKYKMGKSLTDDDIKKNITTAGFEVVSIEK